MLQNGIVNILELESGQDWIQIRRELTDDKISKICNLYEALWPLEQFFGADLGVPEVQQNVSVMAPMALASRSQASNLGL